VKRLKIKISVQDSAGGEKSLKKSFDGSMAKVSLDFLVFIGKLYFSGQIVRIKKARTYISSIIQKDLLKSNGPIPAPYQGTILAVLINLGALIWIMNNGIIPVARSDEYPDDSVKIEEQASGVREFFHSQAGPVAENTALKKNAYDPLSYLAEQCLRDKKGKMSSDLCGEDQMDPVEPQVKKVVKAAPRKPSCREENDHPQKSKQGKGKHLDEDCCPDPDEWPKPGCVYKPSDYGIMLSGPRK
jgi:hypothetical protein